MSFQILDVKDKKIHIKDIVSYVTTNHMGEEQTATGIVIALLPSDMVEIQPEQGGVPVILMSKQVTVTKSLIHDILSLKTNEEFQNMMREAEKRYLIEKSKCKPKKVKGGVNSRAGSKKSVVQDVEVELDL